MNRLLMLILFVLMGCATSPERNIAKEATTNQMDGMRQMMDQQVQQQRVNY